MDLQEAKLILTKAGFIYESSVKGDFVNGEKGGENFRALSNDYSFDDALFYFASAIIGNKANDREYLKDWYENFCPKSRKNQFEKTYKKFEEYKSGKPIQLYRGIIIEEGKEPDFNNAGECWSFSSKLASNWVERIYDEMVMKHTYYGKEKYVLIATTNLENCNLPYSLWLAGRFERPEWEVRVKDETKVKILKYKML